MVLLPWPGSDQPRREGCGGRGRSHPRGRSDKKTNICWKSWWGSPSPAPSACPQLSLFSSLEFPPGQMDGITAPSSASRWTLYVPSTPVSTHASIKMSQSTCPKPSTSTLSLSLSTAWPPSLSSQPMLSSENIIGATHILLDFPLAT